MPTIHIAPQWLDLTARQLYQEQAMLYEQWRTLRQHAFRLENTWFGPDAEQFARELRLLLGQMEQRLHDLDDLIRILTRQAEHWELSDQRWTREYQTLR